MSNRYERSEILSRVREPGGLSECRLNERTVSASYGLLVPVAGLPMFLSSVVSVCLMSKNCRRLNDLVGYRALCFKYCSCV